MEGTRSRLGKTLMPKAGLMSIIVDSLLAGSIDDALIVPVSYTYERVLDQGFVEELLGNSDSNSDKGPPSSGCDAGKERVRESLMGVWASMWSALGQRYGRVRVDFGAPTSLKAPSTLRPFFRLSLGPVLQSMLGSLESLQSAGELELVATSGNSISAAPSFQNGTLGALE